MFFRKFYNSGSLLFISQSQFGDGVKKGSVVLNDTTTGAKLVDDLNEILLKGRNTEYVVISRYVPDESFEGKSKVIQHKMVYDSLEGKMGKELHALMLKTKIEEI